MFRTKTAAVIEEYLRQEKPVNKWDRLLMYLSDWQYAYAAPDAVQVSGYDLLSAVMEIVEEIRGKYE